VLIYSKEPNDYAWRQGALAKHQKPTITHREAVEQHTYSTGWVFQMSPQVKRLPKIYE
jgi:hypothetical protein